MFISIVPAFASAACATQSPPEPVVAQKRPSAVAAKWHRPRQPKAVRVVVPQLGADATCRDARRAYVETWRIAEGSGAPDLSAGHYGAVLSHGRFMSSCGVPKKLEVSICTAVQNGHAIGVTVTTTPRAARVESCINDRVRKLHFPAHPRMDVTNTVFRPQG